MTEEIRTIDLATDEELKKLIAQLDLKINALAQHFNGRVCSLEYKTKSLLQKLIERIKTLLRKKDVLGQIQPANEGKVQESAT